MELAKGTLLQGGKYIIESKLGQGGFGITYLAYQQSLKRKVAIKEFYMKDCCQRDERTAMVTIPTKSNQSIVDKYKKKFISEAQRTSELAHPNIISIIDSFEENDTAYYVMPYMPGGSLAQHNGGKALPEAEALKYIRQVANALSYLHSEHKNHLDVKPGNIVLDQYKNAVLIDFGISKIYDDNGKPLTTTDTLTNVGCTPGYAPPEQQYAKEQFAATYDIYALGATLYRLLTGTTPPDAGSLASGEENLQPLPDTISLSTRNAVYASMRLNKRERTQSIEEFLKILDGKTSTSAISEDTTISTSTSDITTLNFDKTKTTTNTSKNINGANSGGNSGGNSQGNNADSPLNKEVKDTEKKDNLWQKLKIEFAKRHIITNIVLVLCFIASISLLLACFFDEGFNENSEFIAPLYSFTSIGCCFILLNNKNGIFISYLCIVLSMLFSIKHIEHSYYMIFPIILILSVLSLKKDAKSGYNVISEKGSINIANTILTLCYTLFIILFEWHMIYHADSFLITNLGACSMIPFINNWYLICYIITGVWGLHFIVKKKWAGIVYILTAFIVLNSYIFNFCYDIFGFITDCSGRGNGNPEFWDMPSCEFYSDILSKIDRVIAFDLILIAAILIGLFWKHNGKSNFSQMTDGKGIANTKNAIKICVGVIAFAVLAVFVVS